MSLRPFYYSKNYPEQLILSNPLCLFWEWERTQKLKILIRIPIPCTVGRFSALDLWQKESQPAVVH
ncbi:hypothetical protein FY406_00045 [Streptococcus ratti]|nr:hypothetical protein FY406_00045 [Streptococcus ratti]